MHEEFPDLRFGLVLQAAIDFTKRKPNRDLHDYSSKDILIALTLYKESVTRSRKFPKKPLKGKITDDDVKKYLEKIR